MRGERFAPSIGMSISRQVLVALMLATAACGSEGASEPAPLDSEYDLRSDDRSTTPELLDARRAFLASLSSTPEDGACTEKWRPLTADGKLDIVIAVGYTDNPMDGRPYESSPIFATDSSTRSNFTRHLTAPCAVAGYSACGFRTENQDANTTTLTKAIRDRSGRDIQARITLTNASLTFFDEDNRKQAAAQAQRTEMAKAVFENGIRNADAVFYSGHARDGGGPDFGIPRLNRARHVDYDWYQANRPGLKSMIAALKSDPDHAQILGLFACASTKHFQRAVRGVDATMGYIGASEVTEGIILEQSLMSAVDATLGQKCATAFKRSVNVEPSRRPVTLTGFF